MTSSEFFTLTEIRSQTAAWAEAVERTLALAPEFRDLEIGNQRQVMCVGCGSTYYLAHSAASLLQSRTSVIARAFPASELLLNPDTTYVDGKSILIAISRSGATSETARAVSDFRARQLGKVVVLTNYADSPIAALGDIVLAIENGQERSVAQTRSFTSMHVAAAAMADILGADALGDGYKEALLACGNRLIHDQSGLAQELAADKQIGQVFFLGSGPRYGLASEASLKLKEMSQTVSEPFHFLEFRHGPMSMVDGRTLVIGMVSERSYAYEMEVLKEVRDLDGRTLAIGEEGTDIALNSGIAEYARNALYLPILQLFAYYRALADGKDPDNPRHLTSFVTLRLDG